MFIKSAKITNFKSIENTTLEFKPGFNLIKGENGNGKTSVLEALATALGTFTSKFNPKYAPTISQDDVREQYHLSRNDMYSRNSCYPVEISVEVELEKKIGFTNKIYQSSDERSYCACTSPDATKIAIGRMSCIEIVDLESKSPLGKICTNSPTKWLSYTPDGNRLISLDANSTLSVWDAVTFNLHEQIHVTSSFSHFIATDMNSLVFLLDDRSFKIWILDPQADYYPTYYSYRKITGLTTYDHYIVICTDDNDIKLYDMLSLKEQVDDIEPLRVFHGHLHPVYSLVISKDQQILVSTDSSFSTRFWSLASGECLSTINHASSTYTAISPDNKLFIACSGQQIHLWDIESEKMLKTLYGEDWEVVHCSFINDSQVISVSERGSIRLWKQEPVRLLLNCHRLSETSPTASNSPETVAMLAGKMVNDMSISLPVLSYQSAHRAWLSPTINNELLTRTFERIDGYGNALNGICDVQSLVGWCLMMEVTAFQRGTTIKAYEEVKQVVADFMGYMDNGKRYAVSIDRNTYSIMYSKNNIILPVFKLSNGYQALIWMVFDIAYRMTLLNPNTSVRINETPGIVLIDELDAHLHPKWQWKVIDALLKTFPNVQFIATTHSPFLFASTKNVWIIDIDEQSPVYAYSRYGFDVSSSTNLFQNNSSLPEELKVLVQVFYDAMDKEDYSTAKVILERLEKQSSEDSPLLVKLNTMYMIESSINYEDE